MQIPIQRTRPAWPAIDKTENDSRLLKNSEGNRDGEWIFLSKEAGRGCFIFASDKNKKDQKNLRRKLNSSIIVRNRTISKQRILKQETNKTDRNPPITIQKTMNFWTRARKHCFLRGPLRWLTEQENPKFLRSLQNAHRDTTNFAITLRAQLYLLFNETWTKSIPEKTACYAG